MNVMLLVTLVTASTLAPLRNSSEAMSMWPSFEARWRAFSPFYNYYIHKNKMQITCEHPAVSKNSNFFKRAQFVSKFRVSSVDVRPEIAEGLSKLPVCHPHLPVTWLSSWRHAVTVKAAVTCPSWLSGSGGGGGGWGQIAAGKGKGKCKCEFSN